MRKEVFLSRSGGTKYFKFVTFSLWRKKAARRGTTDGETGQGVKRRSAHRHIKVWAQKTGMRQQQEWSLAKEFEK